MRLVSFLSVLIFVSCSVDELPPCEGVGVVGEICKEYQYVYGAYNGANEYVYNLETNQLSKVVTIKKNGQEEGSTLYTYDEEGRVVKLEKANPSGALISSEAIEYGPSGELISETYTSDENAVKSYVYKDGIQIAEKYTVDGVLAWVDSLEYYSETTDLYRRLRYVDNSLTEIKLLVSYDNDVTEETVTNQNGIIQQKTVRSYNGEFLLEELRYSESGSLIQREVRDYDNGKLSLITKYDLSGEEFERLEYYRF